jgi:hypothetical protein
MTSLRIGLLVLRTIGSGQYQFLVTHPAAG